MSQIVSYKTVIDVRTYHPNCEKEIFYLPTSSNKGPNVYPQGEEKPCQSHHDPSDNVYCRGQLGFSRIDLDSTPTTLQAFVCGHPAQMLTIVCHYSRHFKTV